MSSKESSRPKARLPKGLSDQEAAEIRARDAMIAGIRNIYELHGFEPLETPSIEYADALGKFLPDQDRPNEGVFSFRDDDDQWLSLRYDHTAPLARFVAQRFDELPKPFRRYQFGMLWRNEKPGPGRFREFLQFDADTVGASNIAADAEMIGLLADAMEAVGLKRGEYRVRVNNRKVLTGILEAAGVLKRGIESGSRLPAVLRAIDKLDRLGRDGVGMLLGKGRRDESGDFTPGAELANEQIERILAFVEAGNASRAEVCRRFRDLVGNSPDGLVGVAELEQIAELLEIGGVTENRAVFDPSIVRGLGYYTGPVFEAELTFDILDEKGVKIPFGSMGAGGRYDDLVERFKGIRVPATGASVGVSRLMAAFMARDRNRALPCEGPVIVLMMDAARVGNYQQMVNELRCAGIKSEVYLGDAGIRAQLKYADKRCSPVAIIEGVDELARGEVTLKDLILGGEMAKSVADNKTWREGQPAQISVKRAELVTELQTMLSRRGARVNVF